MLRHIGMLRRQIVGMLAGEGILTSAFGVAYGLALGTALSLVLVYVINRQSFNWSIDLAIPVWQLAILSVTLIAAAAITRRLERTRRDESGRGAGRARGLVNPKAASYVLRAGYLLGAAAAIIAAASAIAVPAAEPSYAPVTSGRPLTFPTDYGSHPQFRTEWWYVTGWLTTDHGEPLGFQITFFRTKPAIDEANPSSFAPHQLMIAHCAISDPKRGRLWQDQRIQRAGLGLAGATEGDTHVWIDRWSLTTQCRRLHRENRCGGFFARSDAAADASCAAQRGFRLQPQRPHATGGEFLLQPASHTSDRRNCAPGRHGACERRSMVRPRMVQRVLGRSSRRLGLDWHQSR